MPVLKAAVEELAKPRQVGGVDVRDGRGEQLLAGVAEQRAARAVGGEDPVAERVDDEPRIAGVLEQLPKPGIAMHIWLALHLAGCPLSRKGNDSVAGVAELLPEQPPAGRRQAPEHHLAHQAVPEPESRAVDAQGATFPQRPEFTGQPPPGGSPELPRPRRV